MEQDPGTRHSVVFQKSVQYSGPAEQMLHFVLILCGIFNFCMLLPVDVFGLIFPRILILTF